MVELTRLSRIIAWGKMGVNEIRRVGVKDDPPQAFCVLAWRDSPVPGAGSERGGRCCLLAIKRDGSSSISGSALSFCVPRVNKDKNKFCGK